MYCMYSKFSLFQSCCWAQLPSCSCPIQGHCYCPLAESVRPSLTQIRFLSKWDFYCSKGAGSRISLPQPFPVSSQRGSAALLQFFSSLPHLLWDKSGTLTAKLFLCRPSLDFKEWKEFLKKRYPPTSVSLTRALPAHTHTNKAAHSQTSPLWFCILYSNVPPLSDQPWWCVVTCDPKWSVPMVPQHVASFVIAEKIVLCMQGVSDHTFSQCEPLTDRTEQTEQLTLKTLQQCHCKQDKTNWSVKTRIIINLSRENVHDLLSLIDILTHTHIENLLVCTRIHM